MQKLKIPYKFKPRDYQIPLLKALDSGIDRAFCLWHRRAGKDVALWNLTIKKAFERQGTYFYLLPTYTQAKKIIWDGIRNDGQSFMDHIPDELAISKNGTELKIELENKDGGKSIIQLIGTDNYDSVRGTNPVGVVFSEYAFQNPIAWEVIRPILAANGGWAVFNTTPNGKNHAYDMWQMATESNDWFTQKLTVNDTGVVSQDILEQERQEMSYEMFMQEYFCSFDVGAVGSIYGDQMQAVYNQNRASDIPIENNVPVSLWFDLGMSDATSIWYGQQVGEFWNMICYYENHQKQLSHYFYEIDDFLARNRLNLDTIWLPHDATQKRLGAYSTVVEQFKEKFGSHKVKITPNVSINDGINQARSQLARTRFNQDACKLGLKCLDNYRYKFDERKKVFSNNPLHDWSSHGADAFRYYAISAEKTKKTNKKQKRSVSSMLAELDRAKGW